MYIIKKSPVGLHQGKVVLLVPEDTLEGHCADTQHRRQILRGWVGAAVAVQDVACFIADGKV